MVEPLTVADIPWYAPLSTVESLSSTPLLLKIRTSEPRFADEHGMDFVSVCAQLPNITCADFVPISFQVGAGVVGHAIGLQTAPEIVPLWPPPELSPSVVPFHSPKFQTASVLASVVQPQVGENVEL